MHPKYWKANARHFLREQANDADGLGQGGSGGAPVENQPANPPVENQPANPPAGDGKPQPSDAEAKLLKEVMQKKEALRLAQEESAAAKARLAEFDGIDPVEVRKLLTAQREAEEAALLARGEFDTIKARMAEEHTRATAALQEQLAAVQAQLAAKDGVINELSIGTQFSQSQFISGYALNNTRASQQMPSFVIGAKIALLDIDLRKFKLALGVQVVISDPKQLQAIQDRESDITKVPAPTAATASP